MNKKEIKKIDEQIETYQTKRFFILLALFIVFGLMAFVVIGNIVNANAGLIGVAIFTPLLLLLFFLGLSWAGKYKRMIKDLEETKRVDGLNKKQRHELKEINDKIAEREAIKYLVRRVLFVLVVVSVIAYLVAPLFPPNLEDLILKTVVNLLWIRGTMLGIAIYVLVTLFVNVSIWKLEDKKDEVLKK